MIAIIILLIVLLALANFLQDELNFSPTEATLTAICAAAILTGGFFLFKNDIQSKNDSINVEYRSSAVDVKADNFTELNSIGLRNYNVGNAWYDEKEQYMIIKLGQKNYHYCGFPKETWSELNAAQSLYDYYKERIKGNYDCRKNHVPHY